MKNRSCVEVAVEEHWLGSMERKDAVVRMSMLSTDLQKVSSARMIAISDDESAFRTHVTGVTGSVKNYCAMKHQENSHIELRRVTTKMHELTERRNIFYW